MNADVFLNAGVGLAWLSGLLAGIYYLIGSSFYDAKYGSIFKKIARHPYSQRLRKKPLVSIVVVTNNSQKTLETCLASIISSDYRKYEVIILDNASVDRTRSQTRKFIKDHPKKPLKLIYKRQKLSFLEAASIGLKKSSGQIALVIDAEHHLSTKAISQAVHYVQFSGATSCLADSRPATGQDLAGLVNSSRHTLFGVPVKKTRILRRITASQDVRGIFIRREALTGLMKAQLSLPDKRRGVWTRRLLSGLGWAVVVSWLAALAYLANIAIAHDYPLPLGLALLGFLIYACFAVAADDGLKFKDKIAAVLTLPASLGLLYFSTIFTGTRKILKPVRLSKS